MFDGPMMLRVNWHVVDTIHPQSTYNTFSTGVKIKATGEYKCNDTPGNILFVLVYSSAYDTFVCFQ